MATERVEIRYLAERFSMFRIRVHAERDNVLSIVEVDCYRCPIMTVTGVSDVKTAVERYGLDAIILSVMPREFHCKLLMTKASHELNKWRQEAHQAQLFEIIQVDIDPRLASTNLRPAPGIVRRGK